MPHTRDVPDDAPPFLAHLAAGLHRDADLPRVHHFRLLSVHPGLSMSSLDWVVLVTTPGLHRGVRTLPQPRQQHGGPLPAGRQEHAVVRHGALHHGHAGQRHHVHLHHRTILRGRHALRAVLFRTAAGHGDHLRHRGSGVPSRARLHGVRIPGEALRCQDARAGQHHLPVPARPVRGADDLCAGAGALGHPGLAGARAPPS